MAVIGIDLGTTNSLAAVYRNGAVELIPNSLGEMLTPSVVSLDADGNVLVGAVAKERLVSHPERTAAYFKRFMGVEKKISLDQKQFSPQELSSFVLRQLKEDAALYLGEEVTEAVISVPAYFNDNQRSATREAGLLAGLKVERLVNEPSAAALANNLISEEGEQSYLVFDFGGGTLDVSVVDCFENVIEIAAVSGDNHLGGNDFDEKIAEYFCRSHGLSLNEMEASERAILLRAAEKCKKELTEKEGTFLCHMVRGEEKGVLLNNEVLVNECSAMFDSAAQAIRRALKDSKRNMDDIDQVVLVGGSSKMPVVRYYLEQLLGKKPTAISSPDEVVAQGVGIYAGIKERHEEIRDLVLTDICPFTLGVSVVNVQNPGRPIMSPIIERNSVLPTSKRGFYTNAYDFQNKLEVGVYQGESYYCDENLKLGEIVMDLIPVKNGTALLEVSFSYDINGILQVDVVDHMKNEQKQQIFTNKRIQMSQEEIEARLKDLERFKMGTRANTSNTLVMARGERLYKETTGLDREMVQQALVKFQTALAHQEDSVIRQVRKDVTALFDKLEGGK